MSRAAFGVREGWTLHLIEERLAVIFKFSSPRLEVGTVKAKPGEIGPPEVGTAEGKQREIAPLLNQPVGVRVEQASALGRA